MASLFLIIEERFKEKLGYFEKELQAVKFSDGIEFDREYHKVLSSYDKIQIQTSQFYRYLVEAAPVVLDSVYTQGRKIINLTLEAENRIEKLTSVNPNNIEAVKLLIHLRSTMLEQNKNSLKGLISQLHVLYAKKHAEHKEKQIELTKFTSFDDENIFVVVDLTDNVGAIIDYSSRLVTGLGYSGHELEKTNLTISHFLPIGVGDAVETLLRKMLREISSSEMPQNHLPLVFLRDNNRLLLPFEACLKIELLNDHIAGAVALRRLETKHDYILTKASGQIISTTKSFLSSFGLKSEEEIRGVNVCFIIPDLLRYYIDFSEEDEELYPIERKVTSVILSFGCHLERALSFQRAQIGTAAQVLQTLLMKLDKVEKGKFIDSELGKTIQQRFHLLTEELEFELSNCYEMRIKVHKYDIGSERFKVVEVLSCKSLQEPAKNLIIQKNEENELKLGGGITQRSCQDTYQFEEGAPGTEPPCNMGIMSFPSHTLRDAHVETTRRDTFTLFHDQQPTDRELLKSVFHTNRLRRSILVNSFKISGEADVKNPALKLSRWATKELSDENSNISDDGGEFKSISKSDDQPKSISDRNRRRHLKSISSKSSSTTDKSTASLSIRYLLLNRTNYRILKLNLFIGFIGIIIIQSLYSAQYAGYKQRLDDLTLLCTSISYPTQLGLDQQMLVKEYYKWELVRNQIILPTSFFYFTVSVTFPAYINVDKSFFSLMSNAYNVSQEVSSFLSDPANSVEMSFMTGNPVNMSLSQAILLHWGAVREYYADVVVNSNYSSRTPANAYILIENTDHLYEKMIELNVELSKAVTTKINSILGFNVIMIIVVSVITAILILCCQILLRNTTKKRIEMLSLMCRIPKADLIREWQKIDKERTVVQATKEHLTTIGGGIRNKYKRRSTFISNSTNRRSQVLILVALVVVSWVPFISWFTQTRDQIKDWNLGLEQIDLMGNAQAAITTLITLHLKYYYHLNATTEVKEKIKSDVENQLTLVNSCTNLLTDFMTSFGQLPNQVAYNEESSKQILAGKANMCDNLNHLPEIVVICYQISGGIGGEGLIQSVNYLITQMQEIYTTVVQAQDQNATFWELGQKEPLLSLEFFQACVNRYLRVTSDLVTFNFVAFMNSVSKKATQTFIGISILIVVGLGIGWILWIKRMEKWLTQTKDIYRILPLTILEGNSFIKSYFAKELKESRFYCC